MKTQEELNALKEEVETVSSKLANLSGEELEYVTGGVDASKIYAYCPKPECPRYNKPDFFPSSLDCWLCGTKLVWVCRK